jgi:hypothetical protein
MTSSPSAGDDELSTHDGGMQLYVGPGLCLRFDTSVVASGRV